VSRDFFARRLLPKKIPKDFPVEQNQIFRSKFNVRQIFSTPQSSCGSFSAFIISGGAVKAKKYMATATPTVYGETKEIVVSI